MSSPAYPRRRPDAAGLVVLSMVLSFVGLLLVVPLGSLAVTVLRDLPTVITALSRPDALRAMGLTAVIAAITLVLNGLFGIAGAIVVVSILFGAFHLSLYRFLPTALNGLPDTIAFGTPFDLTIDGDLTLKNTTRPVTFTATITPISAERIEGLATLIIDYAEDFGITIPMLPPIVASVEDTVRLEIEFVAAPVAE